MTNEGGGRWRDRRVLAWALRAGIVVAPVVVAVVVVRVADLAFSPRAWAMWQELLLMAPLALVSGILTERALRRFLPLAMLLRMDMAFPGRAPSRFAVARQSRSRDQLMAMLADRDAGPQQAARAMMTLLAALAGHDRRTRGHSERTRVLADVLGTEMELSQYDLDRLRWAALLHDIGKLEVATQVLNKPSSLTEAEWRRMRLHPVHGAELTSALTGWLGPWADGILHHHEKFDGSGYPAGLAGEEISVAGRVIAVVDAYESMTAARPYQKARVTRVAREELVRCAGTHFDPTVVRAFLSISMPRLLWATGALALLTHLPYLRELQLVGQQLTGVAGSQVATAAGVTAMVVSASAVPAWSAHDHEPPRDATRSVTADLGPVSAPTGTAAGDDAGTRPDPVPAAPAPSTSASTAATDTPGATSAGTTEVVVREGDPRQPSVAPAPVAGDDADPAPLAEPTPVAGSPAAPDEQDGPVEDHDDEAARDAAKAAKKAAEKDAKKAAADEKAAHEKAAKESADDKAAKDKAAKDKAAKKAAEEKAAEGTGKPGRR